MLVFVLLLIVVCLYKIEFVNKNNKQSIFQDYLSIEKTTAIKGIFIIIVFIKHINDYLVYNNKLDQYAVLPILMLGQSIVTMFLFYSGYGVMESIKKKGNSYIKAIPKNRILATLYRFDIALILFFIIGLLIGNTFSFKTILLSMIGWDSLGNSNWYIFVILMLYLFTYISFAAFKGNQLLGVIGTTVLSIVLYYFDKRMSFKRSLVV